MNIPGLSEGFIRQQAAAESYRRGEDYYRRGSVISLLRRGDVLRAEVEGSQYEPYRVHVAFDPGGITDVTCSCPYDWGGWCKHVVAVLLACLRNPEQIEVHPALDDLIAGLDRGQLADLVAGLAAHDPDLIDEIERRVTSLGTPGSRRSSSEGSPARATLERGVPGEGGVPSPPRRTAVDPQPIRRQVSAILHSLDRMRSSEAYWHVGSVVDQVGQVLDQARAFIEAGDGGNAVAYLEAITDEYVEGWLCLDDSDGYAGGFFGTLGEAWTEAALVTDLSPAERRAWADKLTRWQAEIGDYGIDDAFDAAQAAFLQGWDHPPLRRILQGEITDQGVWEDEAPWYADELAAARLKVLDRQGRHQEYLHLARAEGQLKLHVLMLARLGRVREAADEGLQYLGEPDQLLALAVALREAGELAEALRVAEHGLTLDGAKGRLATWLCDLALGVGKSELALRAAVVAFRATPSLDIYLRVQELAGGRWPGLREESLAHLRQTTWTHAQAQVDVFLHEGLLDDAIAAVEKGGGYDLIERVMDAVVEHRPDWVIQAARKQAERIIDAGQSKYYHHAVGWLEKARTAYRAASREAEWQAYLREIRERHGPKYKLMGMLKGL
jgi:uncharacterized Zn finger protein